MTTTTYTVTGMTCEHCVRAVRAEVAKVTGVTQVAVDLPAGRLTVTHDGVIDGDAVRAAIDEAGYRLAATP